MRFDWKSFGQSVRKTREAHGLSLRQLSRQLRINKMVISRVENGKPISGPHLIYLARWMDTTKYLHEFLYKDPRDRP